MFHTQRNIKGGLSGQSLLLVTKFARKRDNDTVTTQEIVRHVVVKSTPMVSRRKSYNVASLNVQVSGNSSSVELLLF